VSRFFAELKRRRRLHVLTYQFSVRAIVQYRF
jgi:hypothetical protein